MAVTLQLEASFHNADASHFVWTLLLLMNVHQHFYMLYDLRAKLSSFDIKKSLIWGFIYYLSPMFLWFFHLPPTVAYSERFSPEERLQQVWIIDIFQSLIICTTTLSSLQLFTQISVPEAQRFTDGVRTCVHPYPSCLYINHLLSVPLKKRLWSRSIIKTIFNEAETNDRRVREFLLTGHFCPICS